MWQSNECIFRWLCLADLTTRVRKDSREVKILQEQNNRLWPLPPISAQNVDISSFLDFSKCRFLNLCSGYFSLRRKDQRFYFWRAICKILKIHYRNLNLPLSAWIWNLPVLSYSKIFWLLVFKGIKLAKPRNPFLLKDLIWFSWWGWYFTLYEHQNVLLTLNFIGLTGCYLYCLLMNVQNSDFS